MCVSIYLHTYRKIFLQMCIRARASVRIRVRIGICAYMNIYVHVYVCVQYFYTGSFRLHSLPQLSARAQRPWSSPPP